MADPAAQPRIPESELRRHTHRTDAWIAVRGVVYDVTPFLARHPGGAAILLRHAGTDATELFNRHHAYISARGFAQPLGVLVAEPKSRPTNSGRSLLAP